MINGAHVVLYSSDADADRAFFRDVLGFPNVDARDGWLIFKLPPAEMAFHPAAPDAAGNGELYLMCDDVEATVAELTAKGVEFSKPIENQGWGLVCALRLPGGGEVGLYQPRHPVAYSL
jgi:catechol 2,3-dioxygenase-like lactoylglutathione lyase family enzyme